MLSDDAIPRPVSGRASGVVVGLAVGAAAATVVAVVGIAIQSQAYMSPWTQDRINSARNIAVIVGEAAAALCLLVLVLWFVTAGRPDGHPRRRRVALTASATTIVAALLIAPVGDVYESYWLAVVGAGLLGLVIAGLLRNSAWRPAWLPMVISTTLIALVIGGTAVAAPYVRHQIPPRELIDWWAAHDNPPIGFVEPLSKLSTALEADPRDRDEVVAACRGARRAFADLTGEPIAPPTVRADVETIAHDLVEAAYRCETEAGTITKDTMIDLVNRATSTAAARRYDTALNP